MKLTGNCQVRLSDITNLGETRYSLQNIESTTKKGSPLNRKRASFFYSDDQLIDQVKESPPTDLVKIRITIQ